MRWSTRWFKYDRDKLWLVYTQSVPVIFEPPCILPFAGVLLVSYKQMTSYAANTSVHLRVSDPSTNNQDMSQIFIKFGIYVFTAVVKCVWFSWKSFRWQSHFTVGIITFYPSLTTFLHRSGWHEIGGACSTYGTEDVFIQVLLWKHKSKKPMVRTRSRWEDNT
jgi:hypothetical protein